MEYAGTAGSAGGVTGPELGDHLVDGTRIDTHVVACILCIPHRFDFVENSGSGEPLDVRAAFGGAALTRPNPRPCSSHASSIP